MATFLQSARAAVAAATSPDSQLDDLASPSLLRSTLRSRLGQQSFAGSADSDNSYRSLIQSALGAVRALQRLDDEDAATDAGLGASKLLPATPDAAASSGRHSPLRTSTVVPQEPRQDEEDLWQQLPAASELQPIVAVPEPVAAPRPSTSAPTTASVASPAPALASRTWRIESEALASQTLRSPGSSLQSAPLLSSSVTPPKSLGATQPSVATAASEALRHSGVVPQLTAAAVGDAADAAAVGGGDADSSLDDDALANEIEVYLASQADQRDAGPVDLNAAPIAATPASKEAYVLVRAAAAPPPDASRSVDRRSGAADPSGVTGTAATAAAGAILHAASPPLLASSSLLTRASPARPQPPRIAGASPGRMNLASSALLNASFVARVARVEALSSLAETASFAPRDAAPSAAAAVMASRVAEAEGVAARVAERVAALRAAVSASHQSPGSIPAVPSYLPPVLPRSDVLNLSQRSEGMGASLSQHELDSTGAGEGEEDVNNASPRSAAAEEGHVSAAAASIREHIAAFDAIADTLKSQAEAIHDLRTSAAGIPREPLTSPPLPLEKPHVIATATATPSMPRRSSAAGETATTEPARMPLAPVPSTQHHTSDDDFATRVREIRGTWAALEGFYDHLLHDKRSSGSKPRAVQPLPSSRLDHSHRDDVHNASVHIDAAASAAANEVVQHTATILRHTAAAMDAQARQVHGALPAIASPAQPAVRHSPRIEERAAVDAETPGRVADLDPRVHMAAFQQHLRRMSGMGMSPSTVAAAAAAAPAQETDLHDVVHQLCAIAGVDVSEARDRLIPALRLIAERSARLRRIQPFVRNVKQSVTTHLHAEGASRLSAVSALQLIPSALAELHHLREAQRRVP